MRRAANLVRAVCLTKLHVNAELPVPSSRYLRPLLLPSETEPWHSTFGQNFADRLR